MRSESHPSGHVVTNPPSVPQVMKSAISVVSRPRSCAQIGPSAKNELVVMPHRTAATTPKGDCR
jgi:hypothetical protein